MRLNRGEWSELYGVLYLLLNPDLDVVDLNLKSIDESKEIYRLKKIMTKSKVDLEYERIENLVVASIDGESPNSE